MTGSHYAILLERLAQELEIGNCFRFRHDFPVETIRDVSAHLKLQNIACMLVALDIRKQPQIPYPFIARQSSKAYFSLVLSRSGDQLQVFDPVLKKAVDWQINDFVASFEVQLLLLQKTKTDYCSKFSRNGEKHRFTEISFLCLFLISLAGLASLHRGHYLHSILLVLNALGWVLSVAYFLKEQGFSNYVFKLACGGEKNDSCLTMKQKFRAFDFSFSQLGILFFSIGCLSMLLAVISSNPSINLLYRLCALVASLFVCYSLYLQVFKLKKFCRLCLCIGACAFAIAVIANLSRFSADPSRLLSDAVAFVCISLIAYSIVHLMTWVSKTLLRNRELEAKQNYFWSKPVLVKSMLNGNSNPIRLPQYKVELGNKQGTTIINLSMSSSCRFCTSAFWELGNLSLMNSDVRLIIQIKYPPTASNQMTMLRFVEACNNNDFLKAYEIFANWHSREHKTETAAAINGHEQMLLDQNSRFFEQHSIADLPQVLINGKLAPSFLEHKYLKAAYA